MLFRDNIIALHKCRSKIITFVDNLVQDRHYNHVYCSDQIMYDVQPNIKRYCTLHYANDITAKQSTVH